MTVRGRGLRIVAAALATHVAANLLLAIVLLLPGAEPVRDALALPILLVAGTAVAARWAAARPATGGTATLNVAALHGVLVGALIGLLALAYGLITGLLTMVLTVATGWLATAQMSDTQTSGAQTSAAERRPDERAPSSRAR